MKLRLFLPCITILIVLLLFSSASAASVFGADGAKETDAADSQPESSVNIRNWPQKAQDFCKKSQDNALAKCEEFAKDMAPGGWWIDRQIGAIGTFKGKPTAVNISDLIVGRFDCPPHNLMVDEHGKLIIQEKIFGESVIYDKAHKEITGNDLSPEEEVLEITCSFTCHAWACPDDYSPNKDCVDWDFTDKDGDGKDDLTGRTKDEEGDRIINGSPDEEGEYYEGLKLRCRERGEKVSWWKRFLKLGKECKATNCTTKEIPVEGHPHSTVLRVCCDCDCPQYTIPTSYDGEKYVPLTYDPFEKVFEPGPLGTISREEMQNLVTLYNENIDDIPSNLKALVGNERINIVTADGKEATYGFVLKNGLIDEFKEGEISNSTIKIVTTEKVIKNIAESIDPKEALLIALERDSIKLIALTPENSAKIVMLKSLAALLSSPESKLKLKPGDKIKIVFKGKDADLVSNPHGVMIIIIPGDSSRPVLNSLGAPTGYTNRRTQNLVTINPRRYSRNTGIYTYPTTTYVNSWNGIPTRPTLPRLGTLYSPTNILNSGYNSGSLFTIGGLGR